MEKRTDESRSVLRREEVGGAGENENHPTHDWQPIFEPRSQIHGAIEACGTEVSLQSASSREL
jgi:hypothetical protein